MQPKMISDNPFDNDVLGWMAGLPFTPTKQAAVIRDLLNHSAEDGMSSSDAAICHRALALLSQKQMRTKC